MAGGGNVQASGDLTAEYKIIKRDLLRVVILNIIILGGMLVLYYTNLKAHYLEHWVEKFVKF